MAKPQLKCQGAPAVMGAVILGPFSEILSNLRFCCASSKSFADHGWPNAISALQLVLIWTWVETASSSIRSGDVLSAYIYLRSGSNAQVGYIQGVNGAMQVLHSMHMC